MKLEDKKFFPRSHRIRIRIRIRIQFSDFIKKGGVLVRIQKKIARLFRSLRFRDSTNYFYDSELLVFLRKYKTLFDSSTRVLELGTFEGIASIYFAKHLKANVVTVDPFCAADQGTAVSGKIADNFTRNLARSKAAHKIRSFTMTSDEFFASNEEKFDFVYIDGSHEPEVLERDLRNSISVSVPGTIVWIDDYLSDYEVAGLRLKMVVDDFLREEASQVDVIHCGYQIAFKVST